MTEPCPECGCTRRGDHEYRRCVNKGQAITMIRMWRLSREQYVPGSEEMPFLHLPVTIDRGSREVHKLVHWGLVEEENVLRPDGGRAGWWRLTQAGCEFVLGRRTVPKYAIVGPRNTLIRLEGPPWSIYDAYREHFDLRTIQL